MEKQSLYPGQTTRMLLFCRAYHVYYPLDINAMQKAARNSAYLNMIDESMAEIEKGGITKTLDDLREMEQ